LSVREPPLLRSWPNEDQSGCLHRSRECGVLGEEAEARMNGLCARRLGGGDDRVDAQIALGRRCRSNLDGFADDLDM
jgi:hypothetical protein